MGFWGRLFGFDTYDAAQRVLSPPHEPFTGAAFADPGYPLAMHAYKNVDDLWRRQPNIRKTVDFIARNVASIPLQAFERVSDTDRQRLHDHVLSDVLESPGERVGPYRFWHSVISDGLLYDRWAILKQYRPDGGLDLVQIPSWRLHFVVDALRRVTDVWYWVGDEPQPLTDDRNGWRHVDLDMLIFDYGYGPRSAGVSPIETLRDILDEATEAVHYRRQVWENGARVPMYIERPEDAPHWTNEGRERLKKGFRDSFTGHGENAGGVPILEDGMKLHALNAFSPQDAMDLEGRRLTAIEVAAAFHVAPELVGAQQGNYSNVREYRQMLYRDSLGPYIKALEDALNAQLVPELRAGRKLYVEANVESKLRGDFIEQAKVKQSATGAPWLTRNEARALENRPPIEGGDALVTPLNVIIGGQASPNDSGTQNVSSRQVAGKTQRALTKADAPESYDKQAEEVLSAFFARQGRVVKSRIGAGESEWWDIERWDKELSDDVFRVANLIAGYVGESTAEALGFDADAYDTERTLAFLRAVSARIAGQVNFTTRSAVEEALAEDDPSAAVDNVFDVSTDSRAEQSAATVSTTFAGFATVEAARQTVGERATKTWQVNSTNPRPEHARMNGETVGLDENFSNGMPWPGSVEGNVDQVAGCRCSLIVNRPD